MYTFNCGDSFVIENVYMCSFILINLLLFFFFSDLILQIKCSKNEKLVLFCLDLVTYFLLGK